MSERAVLAALQRGPTTGVALARALGITRSAVHKQIAHLRAAGVAITAAPGRGYALAQPVELLDGEALQAALAPGARAELAALTLEFDTDSTQTRALAQPAPAHGCALWLAERQRAGQGRRGRAWISPLAAHLYLSLARRFDRGFAALAGLSLVVGVVVAEALRAQGHAEVGVKWPNDLQAHGRKLGGILIQLRGEAQGPCEAVIGLGLNVRMPPDCATGLDQPWCDLQQLAGSRPVSRQRTLVAVLDALLPALAQFERDGLAPFLSRWQALDVLAGRPVRILDGVRREEGVALGIAADGALRVRLAEGERQFHGGEVSVRDAAGETP